MPHVIVKAWPGKTEEQKERLAEAVAQAVMDIFGSGPASVSVGIEEIPSERWKDEVYIPDIESGKAKIYRKPGYSM